MLISHSTYCSTSYVFGFKTKIGYEISFVKYFYKYNELRKTEEIMMDILEIDNKLDDFKSYDDNNSRSTN